MSDPPYRVSSTDKVVTEHTYSEYTFRDPPIVAADNYDKLTKEEFRSSKSAIRHGDHVNPLPYQAEYLKIDRDEPGIVETYRYPIRDRNETYFSKRFLSPMSDTRFNPEDPGARANVQALNGLRTGALSIGSEAAQSAQTFKQLASTATTAFKALKAAKNGNWGNIPGILGMSKRDVLLGKYPANRWLEYQYGWKPLYDDIHDYYHTFKDGFKLTNEKHPFVSRGSHSIISSVTDRNAIGMRGVSGSAEYSEIKSSKVVYNFAINSATMAKLDTAGLANPASIAWEVVPFSFAIDWFIPIGDMLSAFSASAGLEMRLGYVTSKTVRSVIMTLDGDQDPYWEPKVISPGYYQQSNTYVTRVTIEGVLPISLYTVPHPFSTPHVRNAIALMTQLL